MSSPIVTVEIRGLARMLQTLTGPVLIADAFREAFTKIGLAVQSEARERAPVFRGRLRQSIKYQIHGEPVPNMVQIGPNVEYARVVHEGRRPGKFPPIKAIKLWVKRKQIDANPFVIARAIARNGTRPRPYLTDGLAAAEPRFQGYFDAASRQIGATWSAQGGR